MFKSKMVSFGFKNEGSCVFRPGRGPANLEVEIPGNLETFLITSFIGNGMAETLPWETWMKIRQG